MANRKNKLKIAKMQKYRSGNKVGIINIKKFRVALKDRYYKKFPAFKSKELR